MDLRTYLLWPVLLVTLAACGRAQELKAANPSTQSKQSLRKATAPTRPAPEARLVIVNGTRLSMAQLYALEQRYRTRIQDGEYWYDRISGAWGVRGGPTAGFILPGLNLGGPLRADASHGYTGVFVNGRELHRLDVLALQQIVSVIRPGRYWVDAQGNAGYEGGPRLLNLRAMAQRAGRNSGPWSYTSRHGGSVGGDGQGFYYYIDKDSSFTSGH